MVVLRVDPVACDGFGYCAELLPEFIALDEWGFPVLRHDAVPGALLDLARRAVADCPRRALLLVDQPTPVATAPTRAPRSQEPTRVKLASSRR